MSQRIRKAVQSELDPKVAGLIRHIISILGTVLVAFGAVKGFDAPTITELVLTIIGGSMNLYALIASYFAKEKEVIPTSYPD